MDNQQLIEFPASRQQQRLFDLLGDNRTSNWALFNLPQTTEPNSFRQAIQCFVENEENLNTVLVENDLSKYPMQRGIDTLPLVLHFHNCQSEAEARAKIKDCQQKPFSNEATERIRFDVFNWESAAPLLLVTCSKFHSDYHSLAWLQEYLNQFFEKNTVTLPNEEEELLQYIDYSEWQRELFLETGITGSAYWKGIADSEGQFKTIFKKTKIASPNLDAKEVLTFSLEEKPLAELSEIVSDKNLDLKNVFLAAWWQLLKKYTQDAFPVARKIAGRNEGETDRIFGLIEKYLPLPVELVEKENSLWELASAIEGEAERQEAEQEHFHFGHEESTGDSLLFPYQYAFLENSEMAFMSLKDRAVHSDEFELKLEVLTEKAGKACQCKLFYDSRKYSKVWIETLKNDWLQILQLEVLKTTKGLEVWAAEKGKQGLDFQKTINPATTLNTTSETMVDLLQKAAVNYAENPALTWNGNMITYKELDQQSNQLANLLIDKTNQATASSIAVQISHPIHQVIAFVAILKSGNAFLPIDIKNPAQRTAFMLEQSEAVFFISDEVWNTLEKELENYTTVAPVLTIDADALCYSIFTSGTTGNPKGVMIPHRALVNYLQWFVNRFAINEKDATVLFSSMAFDLGYTSLWSALVAGAHLHLVDQEKNLNFLEDINQYFVDHQITYIKCTPSHFKLILAAEDLVNYIPQQQLRLILLGGEPIDSDDLNTYFELYPKVTIVNHYGPTETTIGVVCREIKAETIAGFSQLPVIGQPFGNHQVFILDENNNPLGVGEYGNVHITGPGLALGYLHQTELTNTVFKTLDFDPQRKFYETGDLGRWLPDATIQLAGRKDNQVKVRGYRIEPEEISHALKSRDQIRKAFTLTHQIGQGEMGIASFVVFREDKISMDQLKTELSQFLPTYMIPDQLIEIKEIPLTQNGKVDRKALIAQAEQQLENEQILLPVQEDEIRIADIWATLFNLPAVGINQSFFQLGGHSLLALKMLSQIQKHFDVRIQLADFFDAPNIQHLAQLIKNTADAPVNDLPALEKLDSDMEYYDLSYAQQRIWLQEQLLGEESVYNVPIAFKLTGNIEITTIENYLNFLVKRHESLRTNFIRVAGELKQKIKDPNQFTFKVDYDNQKIYTDQELEKTVLAKAKQKFDLEKDLLFCCSILKTESGSPLVLLNFHHIIIDELSVAVFAQEFIELLKGNEAPENLNFPTLNFQYKEYAAWEKRYLTEARLETMHNYFKAQFTETLPTLNLQTDFERPAKKGNRGNILRKTFPATMSADMDAFWRKHDCSLYVFLLATTNVLLSRLSNQTDIIIGTLESNRQQQELDAIMGCFFNIIPLRSTFSAYDPFLHLLDKVKNQFNNNLKHSAYPFDLLIRDSKIENDPSRSPIFDIMMVLKNGDDQNARILSVNDLTIEEYPIRTGSSKYDLLFTFVKNEKELDLILEYDTDLFKEQTMVEYLDILQNIITEILKEPNILLNEIGIANQTVAIEKKEISTFFNF